MAFTWPVNAPVSQTFASNPSSIQPNGHTGIDFATPAGTPLRATGAGKVVFEGWATTLSANNIWWIAPAYAGICVVIDHGNGILSLYGHLSKTLVSIGQTVKQGDIFAHSGNTGLSTGPHLHFELLSWPLQSGNGFYGRVNPNIYVKGFWAETIAPAKPVITKPNQRIAGKANVNQRKAPNTTSPIVRVIKAGALEEFYEYIHAESVAGNNLWYKDTLGYVHSSGFTPISTAGMKNITPVVKTVKPNERYVGKDNANLRRTPTVTGEVVRVIPANALEIFDGFVRGDMVNGNNIWYKDAQGYAWAGGFVNPTTTGLPDLTAQTLKPNERVAKNAAAKAYKAPDNTSAVVRTVAANAKEIFTHYTIGQSISGNNIWYKDATSFVHSSAFTSQAVTGLPRYDVPVVPKPVPVPVPEVKPVPAPVPVPVPEPAPVEAETLSGIDISNHQAGIDLSVLDSDFFIIKSSEGIGWTDPEFLVNLKKARETGQLVGIYHFARPVAGNSAAEEAKSFLDIVSPHLQVGDLLVLDWEAENQHNTAWAKEWLDIVAEATNSNPLIYMNLSCANTHDWAAVKTRYKLWLAQYPSNDTQGYGPLIPNHGDARDWDVVMWQYTQTGRINGWNGNLDLNVFYGTSMLWDALSVAQPAVTEPDPQPVPVEPIVPPVVKTEKEILMDYVEQAIDEYLRNKEA